MTGFSDLLALRDSLRLEFDTKLEALRAELGLPKGQRTTPGGGSGPGTGDTLTAPEANDPPGWTAGLAAHTRADRDRDLEVVKGHLRTIKEEERAATFSDGTVATPQDLPFPPKLVLPTRMLKESKATCMKCGEGVNPNQHEFKRSFAGTCTECGEGMLSPHHVLHTCPPGTPDFPPEPM